MTIFFTADQHFGHKNIIKLSNRPFSTIEEMDAELIERWNTVVNKSDTVYILGDFAFKTPEVYLAKLNGNHIRVKGSHDHDIREPYLIRLKPQGLLDEYGNQRIIVLCHYSMRTWEKSHYASFCLFGHSHGNLPSYGLSFDVGVDCWNYYPISLDEVEKQMSKLKPIVDYRK
jgi:calcineurin-like phosphoesterase family protein